MHARLADFQALSIDIAPRGPEPSNGFARRSTASLISRSRHKESGAHPSRLYIC
jgi:hypothetical protein